MYDVVIIGGSVSGSILSYLLKDQKVLVIDKRNLSSKKVFKKEKTCGGLLNERCQKELNKLQISIPKKIRVYPDLKVVKTTDLNTHVSRFYRRDYINVDRELFDRYLSELSSCTKWFNTSYKTYIEHDEYIEVKVVKANKEVTIKAKYLVDASGATSTTRKRIKPKDSIPKYVSIQKWYKLETNYPYYNGVFGKKLGNYYGWTIPKDDSILVGLITKKKDAYKKFVYLEEQLKKEGVLFKEELKKEGAIVLRPRLFGDYIHGNERVFLIGEAAGFISPSTAEGFSFAIRSAVALSKAFDEIDVLKAYKNNTKKMRRSLLFKRVKMPFMYSNVLRNLVLRSGLTSTKAPKKRVVVSKYSKKWESEFGKFKSFLEKNLSLPFDIEHVGSTSVKGLDAKPILDVVIVLKDQSDFSIVKRDLEAIGYKHVGNQGIEDREVFKTDKKMKYMTHHLYVSYEGCLSLRNQLTLRNHLRENEEDRNTYSKLKHKLANMYPYDIDSYIEGKTSLIVSILRKYEFKKEEIDSIIDINKK